jgi:hypothetical protein
MYFVVAVVASVHRYIPQAAAQGNIGFEKWIVVITASMLQLIDTSIVNVTLTQMMGNLGASLGDISWVVTG